MNVLTQTQHTSALLMRATMRAWHKTGHDPSRVCIYLEPWASHARVSKEALRALVDWALSREEPAIPTAPAAAAMVETVIRVHPPGASVHDIASFYEAWRRAALISYEPFYRLVDTVRTTFEEEYAARYGPRESRFAHGRRR